METLSFAFGVLAAVAVILIAAVVVGTVKVFKMQNRLNNLESWTSDVNRELHGRITDDRKELNLRIDSLNSYVDSRFDKMDNKFNIKNKVLTKV